MAPVVLALDVGSTSAKAQYFDAWGRALTPPFRSRVAITPEGRADPEVFLASVEAVVDAALQPPAPVPDGVALACAWHGLVGLGPDGRPTTPLSTWQAIGAGPAAAELCRRLPDPDAVRRRTGAPVHPSLPSSRLLWWSMHHPDAFRATTRWCSIGELLEGRWLEGAPGPSSSMASGTGCYDQEAAQWDPEVLGALGLAPGALAPVDDEIRFGLAAPYRRRWPVLAGLPWLPAVGDGACSNVGTGCSGARAALTVGTSAAVRVLADPEQRAGRPFGLFAYLVDPARVVLGASRSNAGNLAEWAGRVLRVDAALAASPDGLVEAVAARPPGSGGVVAEPSLAGERSPHWPLDASGSWAGVRHSTTALDLAQSLIEAAVLGLADAVETLESHVGPCTLIASGRAVASSFGWRRLLADGLGRPIIPSRVEEATARGAALVALERLGWLESSPLEAQDGDPVEPDAVRAQAFARLRTERQEQTAAGRQTVDGSRQDHWSRTNP
jgi:gluconokinase